MAAKDVIRIAILGDTSDLVDKLDQAGAAGTAMGEKFERASRQVDTMADRVEKFSNIADNASSAIADISQGITSIATPNQVVEQSALDVAKAQEKVTEALNKSGAASTEYKQAVLDLQTAQAADSGFGQFAQQFERFSDAAQGVLGVIQIIGGAVGTYSIVQASATAATAAETAALAVNAETKLANVAATEAVVVAQTELAASSAVATGAVTALDAALAASGIGLALLAVGAVGYGIYKAVNSSDTTQQASYNLASAPANGGSVVYQTNNITAPLGSDRAAIGHEINGYTAAAAKSSGIRAA